MGSSLYLSRTTTSGARIAEYCIWIRGLVFGGLKPRMMNNILRNERMDIFMINLDSIALCSPWVTFCKKINALFCCDPDIEIQYDEDNVELRLYVDNHIKADALSKLLPQTKEFGNVTLKITVIPKNNDEYVNIIKTAFHGNPVLENLESVRTPDGSIVNYVMFKKRVVQFFNDDLTDIHGNMYTLYQDIAKEVLESKPGTYFSTCLFNNPPDMF